MLLAPIGGGLLAAGTAPQAINVDVDLTFLVQVGLFVGLMLVLKPVLFDPMLRLFEERERRIDGARAHARRIDEKSATALSTYESEMVKARASANAERDRIRAAGLAREQEILGAVRAETAKLIDEGKQSARSEADRIRAALRMQSEELARDLAGRVLGREVQR